MYPGARERGDEPVVDAADIYKVVSQKSIPAQIRQLILYISYDKDLVDGFVQESTFVKRLYEHFL